MSLSNAPAGYPKKNTEGFDLFYPIGGDGLPAGRARVMYDGQTFEDMKEVREYQRRVAAQPDNPEGVYQDGRGSVLARSLEDSEAAYLYSRRAEYGQVKHNGDLFRDVLSGSHTEIANAVQTGDRVFIQINNEDYKWFSRYNGRLKEVVDEAFRKARSGGKVVTDTFGNVLESGDGSGDGR